MDPAELVPFIKAQRLQRVHDTVITEALRSQGWSNGVIQMAFFQSGPVQLDQPPGAQQAPVLAPSVFGQATQIAPGIDAPTPMIEQSTENKPKIFNWISAIIIAMALYVGISNTLILIMTLALNVSISFGGTKSIFSVYPSLGISSIFYVIEAFILFFIAFKVTTGTKSGFWLSIAAFIIAPIFEIAISTIFLIPVFKEVASVSSLNNPEINMITNLSNFSIIQFLLPILILIGFITTIVSYKKFKFPNVGISDRGKVILTIYFLLFIVPTISIMTYGYINASNNDYGYSAAQSAVSYHIYKPTVLPEGMEYSYKFTTSSLAGKDNSTYTMLMSDGAQIKVITLNQVSVNNDFVLESYINSTSADAISVNQIELPQAIDQAFLIETQSKEDSSPGLSLAYIMKDKVLIFINSKNLSQEELKDFAASLK